MKPIPLSIRTVSENDLKANIDNIATDAYENENTNIYSVTNPIKLDNAITGRQYEQINQSGALELVITKKDLVKLGCAIVAIKSDGNSKTITYSGIDITTIGKRADSNDFSTTANDIDEVLIYNGVKTATNTTGIWYKVTNLGA